MTIRLYVDSSHARPGSGNGSYRFDLSEGFTIKTIQILHVSLANTIHNVYRYTRGITVSLNGQTDVFGIRPGFYSPETLALTVRESLGDVVTAVDGKLMWDLGEITMDATQTDDISLGLPRTVLSGVFETTPVLISPNCVGICIQELDSVFCVTTGKTPCRPTIVVPLVSGHGTIETFTPKTAQIYQCNVQQLSSLTVTITDMSTGLVLDSTGQFSIEILCN